MGNIQQSTRSYEDWMRRHLGPDVVEKDLARKHEKMRRDAFSFLRATYWRWAETVLDICPDLADAPAVLAVGDIHLENFGTWRDADGRLAWGVSDFDEAAEMPYVVDLMRLATSALVAGPPAGVPATTLCAAILKGYRLGLSAPQPLILDRDLAWLRESVAVSEKQRAKFWKKVDGARRERAPARYRRALAAAMPEPRPAIRTARRTAGSGSLGRPRWIGIADWRGAPVVREAKALLPSAWERANGRSNAKIRCHDIANGRYRAVDPWFRIETGIAVRRLSPNNRKIEADGEVGALLSPPTLEAMGFDLAGAHLGTRNRAGAIAEDLSRRKRGWLLAGAARMAAAVERDHEAWKAAGT
jgi:Uncharacterized protein conserved in bacteria (DUF2252)